MNQDDEVDLRDDRVSLAINLRLRTLVRVADL